MFVPNVSAIFR